MKPLKFMFSEYWLEIAVEDYVWDASGDGSVCMMLMAANSYEFFLLGQPIYQKYYTIHNTAQSTIKYAPLDNFDAELPQSGSIPTTAFTPADPPTFLDTYGVVLYLLMCAGFATWVYTPLMSKWFGNLSTNGYLLAYGLFLAYCWSLWEFILRKWLDLPPIDFDSIASIIGGGTGTTTMVATMAAGGAAFVAYKSGAFDSSEEASGAKDLPLETQLKTLLADPKAKAALHQYVANAME